LTRVYQFDIIWNREENTLSSVFGLAEYRIEDFPLD